MILNNTSKQSGLTQADSINTVWEDTWTYITTVVNVSEEPVLLLDAQQLVLAANQSYYHLFSATAANTLGHCLYSLGSGQWNVKKLCSLLEVTLPLSTFFRGCEITHVFPHIGKKVLFLNARHVYTSHDAKLNNEPPLTMLTIEDVSDLMTAAEAIAEHLSLGQ